VKYSKVCPNVDLPNPRQYWVIDAFDECITAEKRSLDNFFSILAKMDHSIPIKIFVSSRSSVDLERLFATLPFVNVQISVEDSIQDIQMFVETYAEDLPAEDDKTREGLVETIVQKSAGCFLWTVLVMQQLRDTYFSEGIEETLHEVPEEMDALYTRNLQIMASRTRTKKLAQTVLTWTLCATRSLTVEELKDAIQLDLKTVVARDLERSISTLCGQFVFVDKHNRVQIVHETARTFLLNPNLDSEFRVQIPLGNAQLGLACLGFLTSGEMALPRKRRRSANVRREPSKNALANYACLSFSEHLARSASSSDPLFLALTKFLRTNILVWIERMAEYNDLSCLMRTAKHLKAYQARRAKHAALLQDDINSWATDLPRIVTEFGTNLSKHPAAIHDLIPPLCPRSSGIYRQFGASETGLQLHGLSNSDWNDRISCWRYGKTARCIACQDQWFAIGLSDGMIDVHWMSTCQEAVHMNHGEPVRILRFGNLAKVLASTGLRMVKMWDVSTGSQLWECRIESDPLAMDFDDDDKRLVVATRSKEMFTWLTTNGSLLLHGSWHHNLPHDYRHIISRAPSTVAISASHKLMAIVYRSMPLCLWDLDRQQLLGFCTKGFDDGRDTSNNIVSVCFNPVQDLNLLAVAYMDGDVALFDTLSRTVKCHATVDTQLLAISPDGRTLAGGDSNGNIKLFDFETLQLLYRITPSTDRIAALAFTGDSMRLMDLRGAQVNVWEPSALVRKWDYADEDHSEFSSEATAPLSQGSGISPIDQIEDITDMKIAYAGSLAICGRNDGSIAICNLNSTEPAFQELYKHKGTSMPILSLDWNELHQIVASVDASSRFKAMRLVKGTHNTIIVQDELLDAQMSFGHLVNQLLISPDGTRLLVSSSTADFVWSLQTGKLVASRDTELRTNWRWFTHPQKLAQVVLLENSMLQPFSWEASGPFSKVADVPIAMGEYQPLDLENIVIDTTINTLVMKFSQQDNRGSSTPLRSAKETSLYTLDLSEPSSQQQPLLPKPVFPSQGIKDLPSANILLGIVPDAIGGRLLVFIAESGWICSVGLDSPAPHASFQPHFFIPSAWLSTSAKIISVVTEKKDILFVRGHEVAIIKKGLEAVEGISIR
jgi:WD40 repeat protein